MLRKFLALALLVWLLPVAALAAPEQKVADRVFLVRDDSAKSVSFWIIVNAGFRDEADREPRGIAHYLEHLVFLGRNPDHKQISARFFPDALANGYTTFTNTAYWQQFPVKPESMDADLEKVFRFYAERLQDIDVSDAEAERERNVVLQEHELRFSRNPYVQFNNDNNHVLQPEHPVGRPSDTKEAIAAYSVAAARAFHHRFYARNNIEIVVHGPVDPEKLKALAQKYLDPLPEPKIPEREWQTTLRHFEPMDAATALADKAIRQTSVVLEKIVRFEETARLRGNAARNLLASYLGSRLDGSVSDELVEKQQLASDASISFSSLGVGVLWIALQATPAEGVRPEQLKAAMEAYLANLPALGIKPATVERFRKRYKLQRDETAQDSLRSAQALVSWFSSAGNYDDWLSREADYAGVTVDDIIPVMAALARPGRQLFGVLSPAP